MLAGRLCLDATCALRAGHTYADIYYAAGRCFTPYNAGFSGKIHVKYRMMGADKR